MKLRMLAVGRSAVFRLSTCSADVQVAFGVAFELGRGVELSGQQDNICNASVAFIDGL